MSFFARLVGKKPTPEQEAAIAAAAAGKENAAAKGTNASNGAADTSAASMLGGLPRPGTAAQESAAALSASSTRAATSSAAAAAASSSASSSASPSSSSSAAAGALSPASAAAISSLPNVSSCCPAQKWAYERCFQRWYTAEFLTGKSSDLQGCATQFDEYRSCVISYYSQHEPDVLVQASLTSDRLLVDEGVQAFGTSYPSLQAATKDAAAAKEKKK